MSIQKGRDMYARTHPGRPDHLDALVDADLDTDLDSDAGHLSSNAIKGALMFAASRGDADAKAILRTQHRTDVQEHGAGYDT